MLVMDRANQGRSLTRSGGIVAVTDLEIGDRLAVHVVGAGDRLEVPPLLVGPDSPAPQLEDAAGAPLAFSALATGESACWHVPRLPEVVRDSALQPCLEYRGSGCFRLVSGTAPAVFANEELTTEQGVRVVLNGEPDWKLLFAPRGHVATLDEFNLALRASRLATHAGFDQLISLPQVRDMELLEHQIRTARTVLRRFRGRAMLCDEVGLGKTVEAGLILSELHLRGLARSVLILVPPSLIEQWQGELRRKFSLDFLSQDAPEFRAEEAAAWTKFDRVIVSIHTAKRDPHRGAILARHWDLVIIDEAHHLRNRTTQLWRFASQLNKQFMLLLTATPVQNNLDELFNLVTLLEPGLLSTAKQFQRHFIDRRDKLTPQNVDELHGLLAEVMVRNRRSTVGLQFTRRWARTESLSLSAAEQRLYDDVTRFVRQHLQGDKERGAINRMALIALQMALGSSAPAAAGTLENMAANAKLPADVRDQLSHSATAARAVVDSSKATRLRQIVQEFSDKMVIFTQFRATQAMLAEQLRQAGHEVAVFHGGLSRLEKETVIAQFRGPARLLLATESGSEGRNLQFAHAICNFDLPWNPMKIEQRIGRLSRIGQTRDVHVFNLVSAGTIEAAVLHLLDAKLSMFELVIGEIDMILGNLDDEQEFQEVVADLWAESSDGGDFAKRMEELGDRLLAAKAAYFQQRQQDDRLFGNQFAPDA
jgi:SNF2 family DNA or RNA helicase